MSTRWIARMLRKDSIFLLPVVIAMMGLAFSVVVVNKARERIGV